MQHILVYLKLPRGAVFVSDQLVLNVFAVPKIASPEPQQIKNRTRLWSVTPKHNNNHEHLGKNHQHTEIDLICLDQGPKYNTVLKVFTLIVKGFHLHLCQKLITPI